jgi:hypothetical protein
MNVTDYLDNPITIWPCKNLEVYSKWLESAFRILLTTNQSRSYSESLLTSFLLI